MALIKCPECGKEISSSVTQCIHCGCTITACPDCGAVCTGERETCPNCGCVFKKSKSQDSSSVIQENPLLTWESSSRGIKLFKALKIIIAVLSFVFLGLITMRVIQFKNLDPLGKLLNYDTTITFIDTMLVFLCIMLFFDTLQDTIARAFTKVKCTKWLKDNDIDGVAYFKAHALDVVDKKTLEKYSLFMQTAFLAQDDNNKKYVYIDLIVKMLCLIACLIGAAICVSQNLSAYLTAELLGAEYEFQYVALIITGVIAVAAFAIVVITTTKCDKKYNEWVTDICENTEGVL